MIDFVARLFDTSDFPARWNCGRWTAGHGWLHILSDLGVWSAYIAIPLLICYFLWRTRGVPFRKIFILFGVFILACGTTHLFEAMLFWWPAYRLAGVAKLLTAIMSWTTVFAIIPLMPRALAMRTSEELEREISVRKAAEQTLRERENLLSHTQRIGHIGSWSFDLTTNGVTWTEETYRIFGVSPETFTPSVEGLIGLLHPDDRGTMQEWIKAALAGEKPAALEFRIKRPDGAIRTLSGQGFLIRDNDNQSGRLIGIAQDMTERKQADVQLEQMRYRLTETHRIAKLGFVDWNVATNELLVSDEALAIYGLDPQRKQVPLEEVTQLVHPQDRERVEKSLRDAVTSIATHAMDHRMVRPDGKVINVRANAEVFRTANANSIHLLGTIQDISELVEAKEAIQQEHDRLRQILDAQFGFVCVLTLDGTVIEINQTPLNLMGLSRDDVLGQRFWEVGWLEPGVESHAQAAIKAAARGETVRGDLAAGFPRLGPRTVDAVFSPLRDLAGRTINVIGFGIDVTDRKKVEDSLRTSEARLAEANRLAGLGMWELDVASQKVWWSEEQYRLNGVEPGTPITQLFFLSLIHPEDRASFDEAFKLLLSQGSFETDFRVVRPDGTLRSQRCTVFLTRDADGRPLRISGTNQDITERKRTEEQTAELRDTLAHASRLGLLGEIASGLAHELNQPLGAIHLDASTALFLSKELDSPELHKRLQHISEQSFRAGEIVRRMRSFIRGGSSSKLPDDINRLVREVLLLLGDHLRHSSVQVKLDLAEHLPPVVVDGIQIQQVLINLVRNAVEAMAQNGDTARVISIRTETARSEIRVSVTDTGCGLDPTIALKLFFPFHTTKADGLGLGLVICRTIVEAHGGRIEARPNSGRGTTFILKLPVAP